MNENRYLAPLIGMIVLSLILGASSMVWIKHLNHDVAKLEGEVEWLTRLSKASADIRDRADDENRKRIDELGKRLDVFDWQMHVKHSKTWEKIAALESKR